MNKSENEFTAALSSSNSDDLLSGHQRLKAALRQAKSAQADRLDSITDIKEADIARLELLIQDLQPVFDAVPPQDEQWDFCLSHGMQPRLWLDASAFVMIARDRRSYRFVRDTRLGRIILAENTDIKVISGAVTRYIASRILERERLTDNLSSAVADKDDIADQAEPADTVAQTDTATQAPAVQGDSLLRSIVWFVIGALLGCIVLALVFRHYGITLLVLP